MTKLHRFLAIAVVFARPSACFAFAGRCYRFGLRTCVDGSGAGSQAALSELKRSKPSKLHFWLAAIPAWGQAEQIAPAEVDIPVASVILTSSGLICL